MSVIVIRATIECDGCGRQFRVEMDPASKVNAEVCPTLYDEAEDAIRGGTTIDDEFCSVQDGMHLCDGCTEVADNIGDDKHTPSRDEIMAALEKQQANVLAAQDQTP